MSAADLATRFIAAFSAADFDGMRDALAPDLVAWITGPDGEMDRVEGRDPYLARIAVNFSVELTQAPVEVGPSLVLIMVEVRAQKVDRTLHNFAAHLLRIDGDRIAEWWMTDAKPAESDAFWAD